MSHSQRSRHFFVWQRAHCPPAPVLQPVELTNKETDEERGNPAGEQQQCHTPETSLADAMHAGQGVKLGAGPEPCF